MRIALAFAMLLAACTETSTHTKREAADAYAAAACDYLYAQCTVAKGQYDACLVKVPAAFCANGDCDRALTDREVSIVETCIAAIGEAQCTGEHAVPEQCAALNSL